MAITLGVPTEQQAMREVGAVRAWIDAWRGWTGAGRLEWVERQWKVLGVQRLPATLTLDSAGDVARWIDQAPRWERAQQRACLLTAAWPQLAQRTGRLFGALADYEEDDFVRLTSMLSWLVANPRSGLYPRQLPVSGIDSKWLENRRALLAELAAVLLGRAEEGADFYALWGLKRPPALLRMRILDPVLRARVGGLGDITAPLADLAQLALPADTVLIVENLQTGLALGDAAGAVVFMALGYGVDQLAHIPWLARARCLYWGDIDTHGLAILHRARTHIPRLESLLMDEATLRRHAHLWTTEKVQHGATELALLTSEEARVYQLLKQNVLGANIRLEQERLEWEYVCGVGWKSAAHCAIAP